MFAFVTAFHRLLPLLLPLAVYAAVAVVWLAAYKPRARRYWHVIDPRRATGSSRARYRFKVMARLHAKLAGLDYDTPVNQARMRRFLDRSQPIFYRS